MLKSSIIINRTIDEVVVPLLSSKKGKQCSYKHKYIIQNNGISFHLCSRHYKMGLGKIKTIYSDTPRCVAMEAKLLMQIMNNIQRVLRKIS